MTLKELKNEVTSLGFDDTLDLDDHILAAANRALRQIYSQRCITRTARIFARGSSVCYYQKELHCINGKSVTLPARGKAFSMRVCGSGYYSVQDGSTERVSQFSTGIESQLIREFLTWGGSIRFWGSFSFAVYDYTVYSEVYSALPSGIPMGGTTVVFDLREIYSDFLAFLTPAKDSFGNQIPGCALCDGRIELSSDYKGEIIITYRRLPEKITAETDVIDLPDEYTHLLPLLAASYVWVDTDAEKALYYKERYDEMINLLGSESYQSIDNSYRIKDGWS